MTLHAIVAALGGDLYSGGRRANVAAPGHSRADRSISLMLDGDHLVIHGFGSTDWRTVRDHLKTLGLIDARGRLAGDSVPASSQPSSPRGTPLSQIPLLGRGSRRRKPSGGRGCGWKKAISATVTSDSEASIFQRASRTCDDILMCESPSIGKPDRPVQLYWPPSGPRMAS